VRDWQARGVPVLAESWKTGLRIGADLLLGANSLPSSPLGGQYQDLQVAVRQGPVILVSGLADAGTPGIASLLNSRQARELGQDIAPRQRFASVPELAAGSSAIVLGSKPNGLPPGLALHAELRALASAGLRGDQVLLATGNEAAMLLGLDNQIGRITPGAAADLVLVNGDPLGNAADALSIVAVVRNGRFFSLVSLLERANSPPSVE
jgi:imidazolonepropionase-like amidohydrolase